MLDAIDSATHALAVALVLVLISMSALGVFFQFTTKTYPGSGYWTAALVLLSAAFLSLVLRGSIPEKISIFITNYGVFLCLCLFYDGLARFHGRTARFPLNVVNHALALASATMLVVAAHRGIAVTERIVAFSVVQAVLALRVFALVRSVALGRSKAVYILLGGVFVVLVGLAAMRIHHVLTAPEITSLLEDDSGLRLVLLVGPALALAWWFSMLLLTHKRTEEELEEARAQAERASRTDRLTGLWNRHHFETEAQREIERAARYGSPVSLLMFDIDHFKQINDRYGHLVGDEVIKGIAGCAAECTRGSDLLCRWGGEEFVVLLPAEIGAAAQAAENLRRRMEAHAFAAGGRITISVGVAQLRAGQTLDDWTRAADRALYRAKQRGRNRVEIEGHDPTEAAPLRLAWNARYSCGDRIIDGQHEELFDLANRLLEKCVSNDVHGAVEAMEAFLAGCDRHFGYEEDVLVRAKYPRLKEHRAVHRALSEKGARLLHQFKSGRISAAALSSFAGRDMTLAHVAEMDADYGSFIGAIESGV